ncbi:MAG TPA: peptidylprolyl isomerase, partial [Planctomycetota bacterium]|nr:peptidylprolyl isomerase [Planctomycetota bacterium]
GLPPERLKQRHRNGFLIRKLLMQEAPTAGFVRPEDIRRYYEEHKDEYQQPARLDLAVIQVSKEGRSLDDARAMIETARARLATGTAFAVVAKDYPDSPSALVQADGRSGLKPDWRRALGDLPPGELGPVTQTARAFCVFRVERETAASFQRFEDVQDKIYEKLEERARLERREALIRRLREKAFIKRRAS